MKKIQNYIAGCAAFLAVAAATTACRTGGGYTIGKGAEEGRRETRQPIGHGWTHEQAAEFWLASVLTDEHGALINDKKPWLKPEELATLTEGHVQVKIPVQAGNPMPHFGKVYRQAHTGGTICFTDSACALPTTTGDTLSAIGAVHYSFCDAAYPNVTTKEASTPIYVQSRGRGLFTVFEMRRVRKYDDAGNWQWNPKGAASWWPAIISVYPGGDSLVISRGLQPVETFFSEK